MSLLFSVYCLTTHWCIDPPEELVATLFPWVEAEQQALCSRRSKHGRLAEDYALDQSLQLLVRFRRILLQDAAVLFVRYPQSGIFNFAPFNNITFRKFASESVAIVDAAEQAARHQFANLPEHIVGSLRGIVTANNIEQRRDRAEHSEQYRVLSTHVQELTNVVTTLITSAPNTRRRTVTSMGKSDHVYLFCQC